jgi:WS/DGAT/MGAT family acyltransferase
MPSDPSRLSEADANFVLLGEATGAPYVPVAVAVYERPFDPEVTEHLTEVMARLLPGMARRIRRDRFSTALHRWEDVDGFDANDQVLVLPPPGDGTLRAVLDWAQEWGRLPMPLDQPPWRNVYFEGVTVDGVPGRLVAVSQFHHALIDGQGAAALAERFYQWAPDGGLPDMPPPPERDERTAAQHWRAGWRQEGEKAAALLRNSGRRLRWALSHPAEGRARVRDYVESLQRGMAVAGTEPLSPLLVRRSDRNRFDHLRVDLAALKAGARNVGGSANDGLMAAMSLALHRYHLDHGLRVREVRMMMPISTRTEDHGHLGNELLAAVLKLPLLDDAALAVKESKALSRAQRDDKDALWMFDRFRALSNRLPKAGMRALFGRSVQSLDLSLSNVKGIPIRNWIAGVEVLDTMPFIVGGPAIGATLVSLPEHATLGVVTCPEAITDPEHLMARIAEAIDEVCALAG